VIPFNKPYLSGLELQYIEQAVLSGKISGDGVFTKKCHSFFEKRYGFKKVLLTTSCTDALEMAAILIDVKPGDEIIAPSYTFVSTVNAFVLRGAKIVFCDSKKDHPNIDEDKIEALITSKTKAIIPVHYAGIACDMDKIMKIASNYNLYVIEDAAQAIDSYYKGKPLGSIGNLAAFSFHETKNIIAGEGGMLVINDPKFSERAEIIREKGTNRSMFFRGEVDKYGWVDIGSSFLPSDIIAAFLYAQLQSIDSIQNRRKDIWKRYFTTLKPLEDKGFINLALLPDHSTNNGHMFYIECLNVGVRSDLINHLKKNNVLSVFHYLSLHKSEFFKQYYKNEQLPNSDKFTDGLLRLPLFFELSDSEIDKICSFIFSFFETLD